MDLPASMYVNYLARRKADHARLTASLASSQGVEDFKVVGHQIKGNATSFGFNDLVTIGEQMEKLNASQLESEGRRLLNDFWHWIEATEKYLDENLPQESQESDTNP